MRNIVRKTNSLGQISDKILVGIGLILLMACWNPVFSQQPAAPDTVYITVYDTVYIHDTVWVKDGVVLESNPGWKNLLSPIKKALSHTKRKHRPEDAESVVTDYFYRDLVDSLADAAPSFNRDSLAQIILANDPSFSFSWKTEWPYYTMIDLKSIPHLSRFDLLRGKEKFYFNWYGAINSGFGPRWGIFHQGIDTHLKLGDSLFASFNGIVRYAEFNTAGYGNCVVIRHFNGLETLYGHLSQLNVKPGDLVLTKDFIGLGGSTGRSDGPHLHFELRYGGHAFDPILMLDDKNGLNLIDTVFVLDKNKMQADKTANATVATTKTTKTSKKLSSSSSRSHVVKKGDTLYYIAKKHNTTVEKIIKLNKLKNKNQLRTGQNLRIK